MHNCHAQEESEVSWDGKLARGLDPPEQADGKVFDMSGPLRRQ